ncbi:MAG: response regulator [Candidatus Riflebacteria bacterium]|nr:response regulator [Candidatus Riflebacteria bacterium]
MEKKELNSDKLATKSQGQCFEEFFQAKRAWIEQVRMLESALTELEQKTRDLNRSEEASRAKSDFLASKGDEIRIPINNIIEISCLALKSQKDPVQRNFLEIILHSGNTLQKIANDLLNLSKLEPEKPEGWIETLVEAKAKPEIEEKGESNADLKVEPKTEPKSEVKTTPQIEAKGEPKTEPKVESKPESKPDSKVESKIEPKTEPKPELKATPQIEAKGEPKTEPKVESKPESKPDSKVESKIEPKTEPKPELKATPQIEPKVELKTEQKVESKVESRSEGKTETRLEAISPTKMESFLYGKPLEPSSDKSLAGDQSSPRPVEVSSKDDFVGKNAYLGRKALVVEDNKVNQKVARGLLQGIGMMVEIADDGKKGVEKALDKGNKFDILFMDVQMPVMDGYEATRKIRGKVKNLPIVAMTAEDSDEEKKKCLEAGMIDYLQKPIKPASLFSILKKWVEPGKDFGEDKSLESVSKFSPTSTTTPIVAPISTPSLLSTTGQRLSPVASQTVTPTQSSSATLPPAQSQTQNLSSGPSSSPVLPAVSSQPAMSITGQRPSPVSGLNVSQISPTTQSPNLRQNLGQSSSIPPVSSQSLLSTTGQRLSPIAIQGVPPTPALGQSLAQPSNRSVPPITPPNAPSSGASTIPSTQIQTLSDKNKIDKSKINAEFSPIFGVIDVTEALRRVRGDTELFKESLTDFRNDYQDMHKKIRTAIENKSFLEAARMAHSLKGVAGSISANRLFETVKELETAVKSTEKPDFSEIILRLEKDFSAVMDALNKLNDSYSLSK